MSLVLETKKKKFEEIVGREAYQKLKAITSAAFTEDVKRAIREVMTKYVAPTLSQAWESEELGPVRQALANALRGTVEVPRQSKYALRDHTFKHKGTPGRIVIVGLPVAFEIQFKNNPYVGTGTLKVVRGAYVAEYERLNGGLRIIRSYKTPYIEFGKVCEDIVAKLREWGYDPAKFWNRYGQNLAQVCRAQVLKVGA